MKQGIFQEKAVESLSTPEQLGVGNIFGFQAVRDV